MVNGRQAGPERSKFLLRPDGSAEVAEAFACALIRLLYQPVALSSGGGHHATRNHEAAGEDSGDRGGVLGHGDMLR